MDYDRTIIETCDISGTIPGQMSPQANEESG